MAKSRKFKQERRIPLAAGQVMREKYEREIANMQVERGISRGIFTIGLAALLTMAIGIGASFIEHNKNPSWALIPLAAMGAAGYGWNRVEQNYNRKIQGLEEEYRDFLED